MSRILFVDDDPAFAEEMKFLLSENGFDVVVVNDVDDAMKTSGMPSVILISAMESVESA